VGPKRKKEAEVNSAQNEQAAALMISGKWVASTKTTKLLMIKRYYDAVKTRRLDKQSGQADVTKTLKMDLLEHIKAIFFTNNPLGSPTEIKAAWEYGVSLRSRWSQSGHPENPLGQLLGLQPTVFRQVFGRLAEERRWMRSTKEAKLAALLALALRMQCGPEISETLRVLLKETRRFRKPAWCPTNPQTLIIPRGGNLLAQLAFLTAHRERDLAHIRRTNIYRIAFAGELPHTAMLIDRGKTVSSTGAYTLHLPRDSLAEAIVQALLTKLQGPYLFLQSPTILSPRDEDIQIEALMRSLTKEYGGQSRQIRRASLSTLASGGIPLQTIRLLSRHRTDDMLRTYLGAGLLDETTAKHQIEMIAHLQSILQRTSGGDFSIQQC
jgi:hypothetical protein